MKTPRSPRFLLIVAAWAVGGLIALFSIGLRKGGFLSVSDVGALSELQPFQRALRPLEACGLRYATRDKRGHRTHLDAVFVEDCSSGIAHTVVIRVPPTWGHKAVGFEMKRSSASEPWKIFVEKNEVPFPDLVGALEDLSPRVVAEYPASLARQRAQMREFDREDAERRRQAQDREERAKRSYPSQ